MRLSSDQLWSNCLLVPTMIESCCPYLVVRCYHDTATFSLKGQPFAHTVVEAKLCFHNLVVIVLLPVFVCFIMTSFRRLSVFIKRNSSKLSVSLVHNPRR